MGNFADLYTSDSDSAPKRGDGERRLAFHAVAKYHIPVAWLALYVAADIHMCRVDDDPETEEVPHLVCRREIALDRLHSRIQWLVGEFSEGVRPPLLDLHGELSLADQPFVHLETMDIGSMVSTPDAWVIDLRVMLSAFDERPPDTHLAWLSKLLGAEPRKGWQRYYHNFPRPPDIERRPDPEYLVGVGY